MGGLAFTKGPNALYTPRMPPDIYQYVRDHCHALLRELFVVVATPIEGPGKSDYGDIDIFVTLRKQEYFGKSAAPEISDAEDKFPFGAIMTLLGAERKMQEQESVAMLAVPWPSSLPTGIQEAPNAEGDKQRFIQVDVHICPDLPNLEWFLFKHAHGDLWSILGSIIRPFGLTVDETGLFLRIPEIEKLDRKKAKVFLTSDPTQVLRFLGFKLDGDEWADKFESVDEVFEYAATSRFFWLKPLADDTTDEKADSDGNQGMGGDFRKQNLKSNDRRRMGQRPLFRKWVEAFLPRCREEGRFAVQALSREETIEEAFRHFSVRATYEARIFDFQKQRQKESLWRTVIKPAIPTDLDPQFRSCAASAFKKIIMEDNTSFGIEPVMPLKDSDGLYLEDKVRRFVDANWEAVGRVAWEQNQLRCRQSLAAKGTKRTVSGSEKEKSENDQ